MNSTLRPTSRLWNGVSIHVLGGSLGDPPVVTLRELSPCEAASSRHNQVQNLGGRTRKMKKRVPSVCGLIDLLKMLTVLVGI